MRRNFLSSLVAACAAAFTFGPQPGKSTAIRLTNDSQAWRPELLMQSDIGTCPSTFGRHYRPNQRKRRKAWRQAGMYPVR